MSNNPGRVRRLQQRRPPRPSPKAALAAIAMAVTTAGLLAAACGASPSSTGSGGSSATGAAAITASADRYTRCMRSHGVPDYPYPNSHGQLPKITPGNETQLGVSASRFNSAQKACQSLWPYQGPTQAQQRQQLAYALRFARCMRSNGVPDFPDPTTDPESGRVEFVISISHDHFDPQSPQIQAKIPRCEHGLPSSMLPGNPNGVEVTTTP